MLFLLYVGYIRTFNISKEGLGIHCEQAKFSHRHSPGRVAGFYHSAEQAYKAFHQEALPVTASLISRRALLGRESLSRTLLITAHQRRGMKPTGAQAA